jgi:hypothetical protein
MTIPPELERVVLHLVREGAGNASWHRLATRLPSFDVPLVPDLMEVLRDLNARGLVTQTLVSSGMDRWAITPQGIAQLEGKTIAGPLDAAELAAFSADVHAGPHTTLKALKPYLDDGLRLWSILRQLLHANPSDAQRVAELGLFLPASERGPFAREMTDDSRAFVRAALFRAWIPARNDVPGKPLPTVPDAELDEILRRGLTDPDLDVREAAAAVTFAAVRGASLAAELVVNLGTPSGRLRWWSILALGGASDELSRELLVERVAGNDMAEAAAAIRALGQRADGRDAWFHGIGDPRPDVRDAAVFALATVVRDLSPEQMQALENEASAPLRDALAAYRARK